MIREDLADRAVEMVSQLADALEELSDTDVPVELPDELTKAYRERDALAELMKALIAENPEKRETIVKLYKEKLEDAEPWADETTTKGPAAPVELFEAASALEEEVRRDRLLDAGKPS